MSKRKASGQLTPAITAKRHELISGDRARLFSARLKSLNQQFAEWVKQQAVSCTNQLWLDGTQQYQDYVVDLLEEFKDIVGEDAQISRQRDQATPTPGAMFSTPVGAAAADGSNRDRAAAAPNSGGSTGRKSVTWADNSTALTPAPGAAANGTPNPNTQNAGHTPAPPTLGRFDAGTPSGSEMPTPQFKLPPSSNAGTPADATPASKGGPIMFGNSSSGTPAASGLNAAAGGFGTPVTAEPDKADRGKDSSSPLAFTLGTPATSAMAAAADKPACDADKGASEPRAFAFGTPAAPAAGASEAAPKSSTPTFGGFGAGSSDKDAGTSKDKAVVSPPAFAFGATPSPGAAAGSSPGFTFGAGSSSAAANGGSSAAAADKSKAPAFNFGTTSSSAAAGGSSPAFTFGASGSGAAGASSSSPAGGFTFGASGSAGVNATSTSGAGGSTPTFAFGSTGAAGGNSSTPTITFGAAGSTPAYAAAGSTPAFGASGSTPAFGTPGTGLSFGAAANGTPANNFFKFPAPSEAAGGGLGAAAADGGDADEAPEPQEEKTQVQRDERFTVLFAKTAVLNMSVKSEKGWDWQNRGKGQMSIRKDTQTGKYYIFFNSDGQGKQLVMHELRARDKPEGVQGSPSKVRLTLLNTLYTVKKSDRPGGMPEPVVEYERRMCIVRFANAEGADEFKTLVEKHKPAE